jgi:hypothetical protein
VSFKLETDERLLAAKARAAIASYGVHVVVRIVAVLRRRGGSRVRLCAQVANELESRAEQVVLFRASDGDVHETHIRRGEGEEIEASIVELISSWHEAFRDESE